MTDPPREPVRIARIISRLNIGGPGVQAVTLTKLLEPRGYETLLVRGVEESHEGTLDHLAEAYGVRPVRIPTMRREVGRRDLRAFGALARVLRDFRPDLVHTHAAKAGTLGRAVALASFPRRRPVLVHTYHGHSLSGYWSDRRTRVFTEVERALGRGTDHLIAVSDEVRDDLVAMGIRPRTAFHVVRLGLPLARFELDDAERARRGAAARTAFGLRLDQPVVTLVARLVPIKRVDRFLRVAALVAAARPQTQFLIVGDGELRTQLEASPEVAELGERLRWTGFRNDMPDVLAATDVTVQTSDNEGTPVSLIEAAMGRSPAVSTEVGGTASVVLDGVTGLLTPVGDDGALARAVIDLLDDPERRARMGRAGREHVRQTFSLERLVDDLDGLYRSALRGRG